MIAWLYILIAALVFFVIGYLSGFFRCDKEEHRYLSATPVDENTYDDNSCEKEPVEEPIEEPTEATLAEAESSDDMDKQEESVPQEAKTDEGTVEAVSVVEEVEEVEPESEESNAPVILDAPRDGKKDNLTRIKGIGPKIDSELNNIGIYHFDQIASWTDENMAWADAKLAFPGRAKRDDWVGQAKLLASGEETEFSKRVDKGEVASSKKP